ncbi:MAG: hypothetical protein HKN73_13560 [Gemmatimonadetes bacterium]|nr:hypothetical protein [Gemmatimonadota bacterium]
MIKTALLLALVAAPPTDSSAALVQRVEIVRTEFGIPHILAEDLKAMGFGLGYVQSEDFSASIATALIESRGTLARHVGLEALDDDFVSREAHARAVETFSRLDPRTQDVYSGFAEGVNHYVRLHPDEFPDWVEPDFTGVDALARDVQTWSRGDAARFVRGLMAGEAGAELPPAPDEVEVESTFLLDGSNAWALHGSRTASGRTILLRNPHLSWATDADLITRSLGSTYYEAHVRVTGVVEFYGDFRIGSAFGIIGGFNRRLGWATTNNYPTYSQVYALARHPELPDHALLDGAALPLTRRTAVVDYLSESGRVEVESRDRWWTPYGPVIHQSADRIYILKDPRDGEFRRGEQFLRMMMSGSLEEWLDVMRMRAHPRSNFTYADADGNIAHYYNARLPLLPHGPTGDTAAFAPSARDIWSELVPWERLPLYVNPPGGYVQQANDTPDFTNLNVYLDRDTVAANLPEPRLRLRSQLSLELVHGDGLLSLDDAVALKHTPRMLLAERLVEDLVMALRDAGDEALSQAASVLADWDRTAAVESRGGVLFKEWAGVYFEEPDTTDLWARPWDLQEPVTTPRGLGRPDKAVSAMEAAIRSLSRREVSPDARWGDVHRIVRGDVDEPAFGCEPTLGCFRALSFEELEDGRLAANRGDAWVLFVEFGDHPRARTVLSYGQTARRGSPHYDDQAGMFARGELKSVAWTDEEIALTEIRRYRPGEEGS